ncbi:helix-turn-helix domain-containing protein [Gracilibacillus xinjiangensis]|uniref:Helix-turn-helix domain-containing protein n=1 Tax=Gracilibacillus xinjiangensis TaxID=1193282 RepID=A0ABV8WW10_9BACI
MAVFPEVYKAISYIQTHLYDEISLNKLADYVGYSPFHFSRIFKEQTGLPPQYFISSLRLQRAKDLLLKTELPIRDIGLEIGQQSLGTFTTKFTQKVGVTPARFRKSVQSVKDNLNMLKELQTHHLITKPYGKYNQISGTIQTTEPFEGIIFVGLFSKPIPDSLPLYGTLLVNSDHFAFNMVEPGVYYLLATSVPWQMKSADILLPEETFRYKSNTPFIVDIHVTVPHLEITLYKPRLDDPPILVSLPLLMEQFIKRMKQG